MSPQKGTGEAARIDIVDTGLGNILSVVNMISRAGGTCRVVKHGSEISESRKIILPGVGSFDKGMTGLRESRFETAIHSAVSGGALLLGLCLGMQLLFEGSEEGVSPGLGLVGGSVRRFRVEHQGLKVPHMGWNTVRITRPSPLLPASAEGDRYYFVHSYYADCADTSDVAATASYGIDFACSVHRGNVFGMQFHPEKSHRFGMALLRRFVEL